MICKAEDDGPVNSGARKVKLHVGGTRVVAVMLLVTVLPFAPAKVAKPLMKLLETSPGP